MSEANSSCHCHGKANPVDFLTCGTSMKVGSPMRWMGPDSKKELTPVAIESTVTNNNYSNELQNA